MTSRRGFLAVIFGAPVLAQHDAPATPKNNTARAANAFNGQFRGWADAFNRVKAGGIDAGECAAWNPIPEQFRKLEHARMEWIRGSK